jgi:hypothetical protein
MNLARGVLVGPIHLHLHGTPRRTLHWGRVYLRVDGGPESRDIKSSGVSSLPPLIAITTQTPNSLLLQQCFYLHCGGPH